MIGIQISSTGSVSAYVGFRRLAGLAGGCSHTLTARARPVPGSRAPRELSLSRAWSADDATKFKRLPNIQPSLEPKRRSVLEFQVGRIVL